MSGQDYVVPPLSWAKIGDLTDALRIQFSLAQEPYFPVMEFVEMVLDQRLGIVRLEIAEASDMGAFEGLTDPNGDFIRLRGDVYEKACNGEGRARFTVAHEVGHLALHTNIPMARTSPVQSVEPFRRCEPQANQYAAELLMPRHFMQRGDTVATVIRRHGVSQEAARHRLIFMEEKVWRT